MVSAGTRPEMGVLVDWPELIFAVEDTNDPSYGTAEIIVAHGDISVDALCFRPMKARILTASCGRRASPA